MPVPIPVRRDRLPETSKETDAACLFSPASRRFRPSGPRIICANLPFRLIFPAPIAAVPGRTRSFFPTCLKRVSPTVDKDHMIGNNPQVDVLTRVLDVAALRHEVIAHNVANINTPGYRRLEVRFDTALLEALAEGKGPPAVSGSPVVAPAEDVPTRLDGNSVDIDREMGDLAKNSLLMRVCTQLVAVQLGQMRSAISGR